MKFRLHSNQSLGNAVARDEAVEAAEMELDLGTNIGFNTALVSVLSDLSSSIKDLATATAMQKQPIVVNLIANNETDLKKFATIFAQGIK